MLLRYGVVLLAIAAVLYAQSVNEEERVDIGGRRVKANGPKVYGPKGGNGPAAKPNAGKATVVEGSGNAPSDDEDIGEGSGEPEYDTPSPKGVPSLGEYNKATTVGHKDLEHTTDGEKLEYRHTTPMQAVEAVEVTSPRAHVTTPRQERPTSGLPEVTTEGTNGSPFGAVSSTWMIVFLVALLAAIIVVIVVIFVCRRKTTKYTPGVRS